MEDILLEDSMQTELLSEGETAPLLIPCMSNGKNNPEKEAVVNYLDIYELKGHCQHGKLPLNNLTLVLLESDKFLHSNTCCGTGHAHF